MTYQNTPRSVLAGQGLKQSPLPNGDAGAQSVTLESNIATTTSLGVVQVGGGLSITPAGVLSATSSGGDFVNVTLTSVDYTAVATDLYVGATNNNITITLPLGTLGRVYYVKNQVSGNIRVQGTGGETIDGSLFQTLGSNAGFIVVFDGSRWNIL